MLIGYQRQAGDPHPLPTTIAALLRQRGTGETADELAYRLIDRTTETLETATYAQLYRRSVWVAHTLAQAGVQSGEPIILFTETCLEFYYALFGAMLLGALPVAVAPPLSPQQRGAALERLGRAARQLRARAIVTSRLHASLADQIGEAGHPKVLALDQVGEADGGDIPGEKIAADAPVLLQYTSGTLGDPKPLALSTRGLLANLRSVGDAFAIRGGDVGLSWLPLYHDMGLQCVFFSLLFLIPMVVMAPTEFLRRPACWLRAISRYRVTHSPDPPFGYLHAAERIADDDLAGIDLGRWRVAMCGSDIIDHSVLERFAERFGRHGFQQAALMAAYGLAENTVAVSFASPDSGLRVDYLEGEARAEMGGGRPPASARPLSIVSVGSPVAGHAVRVVDAAGQEVPDRTQGEIEVRGPSQMLGYCGDGAFHPPARDGEWLRTGDLGYVRSGELFATGLKKDLISSGGSSYHAHLIERAASIEGIRPGAVAAFARPAVDAATQEVVIVAEVRHRELLGSLLLQDQTRQAVWDALGVSVSQVVLVEQGGVPKTTSGKLRRSECRLRFEGSSSYRSPLSPWGRGVGGEGGQVCGERPPSPPTPLPQGGRGEKKE